MDAYLKNYMEYENSLSEFGVNLWERDEVQNLLCSYVNLLAYCTKDISEDKRFPNNLDYFIWDTEFGAKADEYVITEPDGTEVKLHTVEDLWDYVVKNNPDINDTETGLI